jgi:hypothetical protein
MGVQVIMRSAIRMSVRMGMERACVGDRPDTEAHHCDADQSIEHFAPACGDGVADQQEEEARNENGGPMSKGPARPKPGGLERSRPPDYEGRNSRKMVRFKGVRGSEEQRGKVKGQ